MRLLLALFFLLVSVSVSAVEFQSSDSKLLQAAGIPIYPKAVFGNGDKDSGYWFVTSEPPENPRAWYRQQLPEWQLYSQDGGWILYHGAPAKGMAGVISRTYISIEPNNSVPLWFSLDNDMTTAIFIQLRE